MWNRLNLFQYQQLIPLLQSDTNEYDYSKIIAVVNSITLEQVYQLTEKQYYKKFNDLQFLKEAASGKPQKYIHTDNGLYECNYDVMNMPCARYIESKVFFNDLNNNLHKIGASMVIPIKKRFFKYTRLQYDASNHSKYSQDILSAKFKDIYFSIIQFLKEIKNLDSQFDGLFDSEVGLVDDITHVGASKFTQIYGWQYCVKQVADHENIKLNEAYELSTIQFLNSLAYIKAEADFKKNG